jgi:enoyl-CoA hydratase
VGIVVSLDGAIAVVEIDRQANLNALDIATVTELEARLRELSADARVRCVVLTGAGERAFIGGADLEYMSRVTAEEARQFAVIGHEVGRLLETMPKATIAAVNGYALGGGCEVALACDIRYASSNAKLGQPARPRWRRPRSSATARSRAGIRRISRPSASASRRCS